MKVCQSIAISIAILFSSSVPAEIMLFSKDNKFHGCLDCSNYASESICNEYGKFGSEYSADSIWNEYGIGSQYNASSPFNLYGNGMKMVGKNGRFYGILSIGKSELNAISDVLQKLWDASNENYDVLRERFCALDLSEFSAGSANAPDPLSSPVKVIIKPRQCRGYFLADGDSGGAYLLEWYGGHEPEVGESIYGDLRGYGFKDVYYPSSKSKGRVYVDDYMLSSSRAREKLSEKCR